MVPIKKKPIITHIINHYYKFGVREVIIASGYKHGIIKTYFKKNIIHKDLKIKVVNTGLNTFLTAGFSTSTFTGGDQFINTNYYDLEKSEDFLGVNLQPFIGINSQYNIARNLKLTLGYNFSKAFHLFNNSEEKISYNTHQIKVGFLVSLYR